MRRYILQDDTMGFPGRSPETSGRVWRCIETSAFALCTSTPLHSLLLYEVFHRLHTCPAAVWQSSRQCNAKVLA